MPQTTENTASQEGQEKKSVFYGLTAEQIYGQEIAARIKASCQGKSFSKNTIVALKSDLLEMRAQQSSSRAKLP